MGEKTVYLSLGSNIGDRAKNLHAAIAALPEAEVRVTKVSSFYETEPVDLREQPWFLNCVIEGVTEVRATQLLKKLREIESDGKQEAGSKRAPGDRPGHFALRAGDDRYSRIARAASAHAFAAVCAGAPGGDCGGAEASSLERHSRGSSCEDFGRQ